MKAHFLFKTPLNSVQATREDYPLCKHLGILSDLPVKNWGIPNKTCPSKTSNHNYEVDFLLSRGAKSKRDLVYTKDYKKDGETTLFPVPMTMFL